MYKIIAILGPSGSGKDTLLNRVVELQPDWHKIVLSTTRPKRDNETNESYHFLTTPELDELIKNKGLVTISFFNNWFYGITKDDLNKDQINIGVFSPDGYRQLCQADDIEVVGYLLKVPGDNIRLARQLLREENPDIEEIFRRYHTDQVDFAQLDTSKLTILENSLVTDIDKNAEKIIGQFRIGDFK